MFVNEFIFSFSLLALAGLLLIGGAGLLLHGTLLLIRETHTEPTAKKPKPAAERSAAKVKSFEPVA